MSSKILHRLPDISKYGCQSMIFQSKMPFQIKETTSSAIKVLKQVALHHKIVSISANQIDLQQRFFVCLKKQFLVPGKWRNYDNIRYEDQYEAIVNPHTVKCSKEQLYAAQQCPSFQGLQFYIWAPKILSLYFTQQNNLKKQVNKQVKGFQCRVWDHEIRHLEGVLPIYENVCKNQFFLLDEYKNSYQFVDFYQRLRKHQRQFTVKKLKQAKREMNKQSKKKGIGNMPLTQETMQKLRNMKSGINPTQLHQNLMNKQKPLRQQFPMKQSVKFNNKKVKAKKKSK